MSGKNQGPAESDLQHGLLSGWTATAPWMLWRFHFSVSPFELWHINDAVQVTPGLWQTQLACAIEVMTSGQLGWQGLPQLYQFWDSLYSLSLWVPSHMWLKLQNWSLFLRVGTKPLKIQGSCKWLHVLVSFTVNQEEEASAEELPVSVGLWPCLWETFLMNDWCRRGQSTVGYTMPWKV